MSQERFIYISNQAINVRIVPKSAIESSRTRRNASTAQMEPQESNRDRYLPPKRIRLSQGYQHSISSELCDTDNHTHKHGSFQETQSHGKDIDSDTNTTNDQFSQIIPSQQQSSKIIQCINCMTIIGDFDQSKGIYQFTQVLPSH